MTRIQRFLNQQSQTSLNMFKINRAIFFFIFSILLIDTSAFIIDSPKYDRNKQPKFKILDDCNDEIYCKGELLKTIQLTKIFKDSKTFVDLVQKDEPKVTLQKFEDLMTRTRRKPSEEQLKEFIKDAFTNQTELEEWIPSDWTENPPILSRIDDPKFQKFAKNLTMLWKTLARKIKIQVKNHPERHSLIYANNGFIIPGGRFKEFYYWDSYWIIKGLLVSNMYETAKGMIQNFVDLVNEFGFIPNGGRVYYLMRSQPPLLTYMVKSYIDVTQDYKFLKKILPSLDREFDYWEQRKIVDVKYKGEYYKMARYYVNHDGPRPESYRVDYENAQKFTRDAEKTEFYKNVKSGAESGWDFSSRWFISEEENGLSKDSSLLNITTKYIIPVDLNSFLERNAKTLSKFHTLFGHLQKSLYYSEIAERYRDGIEKILWNEKDGIWYDYDMLHKTQRNKFYASNFAPLYTRSYNNKNKMMHAKKALKYIKKMNVVFRGGIPTSLENTGEQWDLPNGWAPLQSMIIIGLHATDYKPAITLSKMIATKWLRSNYQGLTCENKLNCKGYAMYEKYNVDAIGETGTGGEYDFQAGFGWTNGVALELLDLYCTTTVYDTDKESNKKCTPIPY